MKISITYNVKYCFNIMIFKHLNLKLFIIGLTIDCYIFIYRRLQKLYIYSTENINTYQYQDKADQCFSYSLEE